MTAESEALMRRIDIDYSKRYLQLTLQPFAQVTLSHSVLQEADEVRMASLTWRRGVTFTHAQYMDMLNSAKANGERWQIN